MPEDVIQDTVKHYFTFSEDLFIAAKRSAPKNAQVKPPTELSAIVMNNSLLDTDKVRYGFIGDRCSFWILFSAACCVRANPYSG